MVIFLLFICLLVIVLILPKTWAVQRRAAKLWAFLLGLYKYCPEKHEYLSGRGGASHKAFVFSERLVFSRFFYTFTSRNGEVGIS